jgi:hypothetical protein
MMAHMQAPSGNASLNPWTLIRLTALLAAVLVFGLAGLEPGVRTVGGLLVGLAAAQAVRRVHGTRSACEVSSQLSLPWGLTLAAVQAGAGLVMLGWPGVVLRLLGVPSP